MKDIKNMMLINKLFYNIFFKIKEKIKENFLCINIINVETEFFKYRDIESFIGFDNLNFNKKIYNLNKNDIFNKKIKYTNILQSEKHKNELIIKKYKIEKIIKNNNRKETRILKIYDNITQDIVEEDNEDQTDLEDFIDQRTSIKNIISEYISEPPFENGKLIYISVKI